MRVRLLAKHIIAGIERLPREELDLPVGVVPTVLMEPLDSDAEEAIAEEKRRVWPDGIDRGLTNPPEPLMSGGGPGR